MTVNASCIIAPEESDIRTEHGWREVQTPWRDWLGFRPGEAARLMAIEDWRIATSRDG